jgi:hypothetical protein
MKTENAATKALSTENLACSIHKDKRFHETLPLLPFL